MLPHVSVMGDGVMVEGVPSGSFAVIHAGVEKKTRHSSGHLRVSLLWMLRCQAGAEPGRFLEVSIPTYKLKAIKRETDRGSPISPASLSPKSGEVALL